MDPDIQPIVIDAGSGFTKCGFTGDNSPRAIFPTIVGRPRNHGIMFFDQPDCYVGDEAQAKRGILRLKYPIEHGMVTNWNDMEKIWHHTFYNELRVTPEEHSVLLAETPLNPKNNREKTVSIMFETFNVFAFCVMSSSVMSLFSAGDTSGVSVEMGDGVCHVVPVYEGHEIQGCVKRMNLAGRDATDYLVKILCERGYEMTTSAEREIVRDIKEKHCYVCQDYESDLQKFDIEPETGEEEYELPDGSKMSISSERFRSPEIFFKPSLIGSEINGIHQQIADSIISVQDDGELKELLAGNISVSGGSAKYPGLMSRIEKDVDNLLSSEGLATEVKCPEFREYAAWSGGSIFSSLSWFTKNKYITKDDYDDCGASIVHRKCF